MKFVNVKYQNYSPKFRQASDINKIIDVVHAETKARRQLGINSVLICQAYKRAIESSPEKENGRMINSHWLNRFRKLFNEVSGLPDAEISLESNMGSSIKIAIGESVEIFTVAKWQESQDFDKEKLLNGDCGANYWLDVRTRQLDECQPGTRSEVRKHAQRVFKAHAALVNALGDFSACMPEVKYFLKPDSTDYDSHGNLQMLDSFYRS